MNKHDFNELLQKVHAIGKDVIRPSAHDVDKAARFPKEGIEALKAEKLLSAYVPKELGGMGLNIAEVSKVCEVLGQYCGAARKLGKSWRMESRFEVRP